MDRAKRETPLTRSSIEFYIGMVVAIVLVVFPMTWYMRIPLFVILCAACVDFCWHSPFTLKNFSKPARTVVCLAIFGLLAWVGWDNVTTARQAESFPPRAVEYFKYWGSLDQNLRLIKPLPPKVPFLQGTPGGRIVVDTSKFKDYSDKYRLWAACFHWNATEDPLDTDNISHSNFFDISGTDVLIVCSWNQQYLNELLSGKSSTNYYVLLVPKKVEKTDFKNIREALASGGYILEDRGGPP
jgi:hypothetical protein